MRRFLGNVLPALRDEFHIHVVSKSPALLFFCSTRALIVSVAFVRSHVGKERTFPESPRRPSPCRVSAAKFSSRFDSLSLFCSFFLSHSLTLSRYLPSITLYINVCPHTEYSICLWFVYAFYFFTFFFRLTSTCSRASLERVVNSTPFPHSRRC